MSTFQRRGRGSETDSCRGLPSEEKIGGSWSGFRDVGPWSQSTDLDLRALTTALHPSRPAAT